MTCCTQILEADSPPIWGIGATNSPSYVEDGLTSIAALSNVVPVMFKTEKASATYTFVELSVENVIDAEQQIPNCTCVSRRKDGFTVLLDELPVTANYRLRWHVVVTQI